MPRTTRKMSAFLLEPRSAFVVFSSGGHRRCVVGTEIDEASCFLLQNLAGDSAAFFYFHHSYLIAKRDLLTNPELSVVLVCEVECFKGFFARLC